MNMQDPQILDELPIHSDPIEGEGWERLRLEGLVARPLELGANDLAGLPQQHLTEDFRCTDGWTVPELAWEGVPLRVLLDMAGPSSDSNYVTIYAGDYTVGLPLYEVYNSNVLIALRLNSRTLTTEHGRPCRLVVSGRQCDFSVKWVDRIEVTAR